MPTTNILQHLLFQFILFLSLATTVEAQNCMATTMPDFYTCYGGSNEFNVHSQAALETLISIEDAINDGAYIEAQTLLNSLFTNYPVGSDDWWGAYGEVNGANIGTPHAYYGLRMMQDIVEYYNENGATPPEKKVNMTVVMVGCNEGIMPTTDDDVANGTGVFTEVELDPAVLVDDYRVFRQALSLFEKYITAITNGKLEVELEFLVLPEVCLTTEISDNYFVTSGIYGEIWDYLDQETKDTTDFWWLVYPSFTPESPDFDDDVFISGGMGGDSKGGPVFISDDKWLLRKPAHLGEGTLSDIERRIYFPQWLQHEFYHHLFNIFPEHELEVNGHDWFNLNFWPDDFVGQFETDFYAEALHKRMQLENCEPLATRLITRVETLPQGPLSELVMDELIGEYSLDNVQNNWHTGELIEENSLYYWRNDANVQWQVTPNFVEGKLETGADCPYLGQDFFLNLYQKPTGDYLSGVMSLQFNGDVYKKRFNILQETAPIEITTCTFERVAPEIDAHTGEIAKVAGQFSWENTAGDVWSLSPNAEEEYFELNNDSPTPGERFNLILAQDDCTLHTLGFEYLNEYYWKPKRNDLNPSPILISPIADLILEENFGTYSFDISEVFTDPQNEVLMLFASSSETSLLNTNIANGQLELTGGALGICTIWVMAIDDNGGLVVDEFTVQVVESVSTNSPNIDEQLISIFPNPTQNLITFSGMQTDYAVSIFSVDQTLQQTFILSTSQAEVSLQGLSSGVYFVLLKNRENGEILVKKLLKY